MTEKEAKTKWCPFVRFVVGKYDGENEGLCSNRINNVGDLDVQGTGAEANVSRCIGSACMAWRWSGKANIGPTKDNLPWVEGNEAEGYTAVAEHNGYCGLAGAPR